jgi:tape measure domain-containing protein
MPPRYGRLVVVATADTTQLEASVRKAALSGAETTQQTFGRAWSGVTSAAQRAAAAVSTGFSRAWSGVSSAASRAASAVTSGFSRAASGVATGFSRAFAGVQTAAGRAASAASSVFSRAFGGAGTAVSNGLGRAFSAVQGAAGRAASAAASVFGRAFGGAGSAVTSGLARAFDGVQSAAGRAAAAASSVFGRAFGGAGSAVTNSLSRAFAGVQSAGGRAAEAVSGAFSRAGGSGGNSITNGLSRAFSAVQSAGGRAAESISGAFSRMGTSLQGAMARNTGGGGGGGLSGMLASLQAMPLAGKAAAAGIAILGGSVIKTGVEYNTLMQTSRAAFTTVLGSADAADKMLSDLQRFAKTSPFPRQAFIEATQQMVSFGIESNKVIPYLSAIQDTVAATGGNAQTLSEVTLVMSQIQAAGKITGVDLMQFAQRGINAADLIGSAMGKTGTQIKEEITAGSLDATVALDALTKGMDKQFGGAADNLKTTWAGTTDSLKGAMRDVGAALVAPFIDPKGGGYAVEWGQKLANAMRGAIPAVTAVMNGLAQVIGWAAAGLNVLVGVTGRFSGWLGPVAGGVAAVVVAFKLYQLTMQAAALATTLYTAVVNGAKFAVFALNYAWVTSPIGLVVLAIIGLVAAFAIAWQKSAAFRNFWIAMWNAIRTVAVGTWNAVSSATTTVWNAVYGTVQRVVSAVLGWLRANWPLVLGIITGPIGMAVIMVIRYWGQIKAGTAAAVGAVRSVVTAAWNALLSVTTSVWNAIRGALTAAWNAIRSIATGAANAVRSAVTAAWNAVQALTARVWNAILSTVSAVWGRIRNVTAGAAAWVQQAVANAWNWISATTARLWNAIFGAISAAWGRIRNLTGQAGAWVQQAVTGAWNGVLGITTRLWGAIGNAVRAAWENIKNISRLAWTWISTGMANTWNAIRDNAARAWGAVADAVGNAWNKVKSAVGAPVRFVVDKIVNPLVKGINALVTKIGIPAIPSIALPGGFREGGEVPAAAFTRPAAADPWWGRVPGGYGGGDTQLIMAEPGEWVLTKRQARGLGYGFLRGLPRYADGGMVGGGGGGAGEGMAPTPRWPSWANPGAWAKGIAGGAVKAWDETLKLGKGIVDEFSGMLRWAAAEAFEAMTSPLRKAAEGMGKSDHLFTQYFGKLGVEVIDGAIEFIKGKSTPDIMDGMGGDMIDLATSFNGRRYVWGGGANPETGFDCSSFVSYVAGTSGLPLPGNFKVPSKTHGPVTGDYLSWGGMKTIPWAQIGPGDVGVNSHHIILSIGTGGKGFAARSTATGIGPQTITNGAYTVRRWNAIAAGGGYEKMFSMSGGMAPVSAGSKSQNLITIARALIGMGWSPAGAAGASGNIYQESMGDPLSAGTGGRGLIGWTPPGRLPNSAFIPGNPSVSMQRQIPLVNSFFRQNMGRYWALAQQQSDPGRAALVIMNMGERPAGSSQSNPFFPGTGTSKGSLRASIARTVFNSVRSMMQNARAMAGGGVLREEVVGIGPSGHFYHLAERGPELVSPLNGGESTAERRIMSELRVAQRGGAVINVYPQAGQSEEAVAAMVARRMAWADAGGLI